MRTIPIIVCIVIASAGAASHAADKSAADRERDRQRAIQQQMDSVRRDIDRIRQDVTSLERNIDSRMEQIKDAPKTVDPAKAALAEAEKTFEKSTNEMKDSAKRVADGNAKLQTLIRGTKGSKEAAQLEAAEKKLQDSRDRMETIRKPALDAAAVKDPAYKALVTRHAAAKKRVEDVRTEQLTGRGTTEAAVEAASEMIDAETQLREAQEKVLWANEEYMKALKALDAAEEEEKNASRIAAEKLKSDPVVAQAEAELVTSRKALAEAQDKLREASKVRAAAKGKLDTLKGQFQRFAADTDALSARKKQLENQLTSKQRQYDNLQRDYRR